jgi:hypothetical protein
LKRVPFGFFTLVILSILGPLAISSRAADWTVLFRSSDSKIWDTSAGEISDSDGYAIPPASGPLKISYLRLKRMDTGDAVIIAIPRHSLLRNVALDDEFFWTGWVRMAGGKHLLGVSRKSWVTAGPNDNLVSRDTSQTSIGYRGWGFSKALNSDDRQTYSWAGKPIDKTVFEIAVSNDVLDSDEKSELLTSGSAPEPEQSPSDTAEPKESSRHHSNQPEGIDETAGANGPATQISKLQTSIEALYVIEQTDGGMLGSASRFILTATPGHNEHQVPVEFTTRVGPQMRLVLDDVTRAIDVHYGIAGVRKIELSFEDKYDAHDGGSIGAAIGTLLLSLIKNFDIDPNLAMTGDVSADAQVHRIGGVAAKLRGAAEAGSTIVVLPSENLEQVTDAMVYQGPAIVTNVQVLGVANLDEACAVARIDRAADLAKALQIFGEVRESIKASPDYLYSDEAMAKLQKILALAPNDYSASLLITAAQRKIPRLTAAASEYYTFVAVREIEQSVSPAKGNGAPTPLTKAAVDAALGKLNKLRPIADLTVRPWIDSWITYIEACNGLRLGQATRDYVQQKYQAMMEESVKLDANEDLSEKLLREGV